MFEFLVVGPTPDRLGIVQQCIACRAAAGADAPMCSGFGPGCLVRPGLIWVNPTRPHFGRLVSSQDE